MARQTREKLFEKVVETLKKNPKTIHQVAKATDINWETVKKTISVLSKINLVKSSIKNGKEYFSIGTTGFIKPRKDTLMGLPITQEQEHRTKQLLKRIEEIWSKIVPHRKLGKTFRQKILVKLIKSTEENNVPYGWFLYGQCAVLYNPDLTGITSSKQYDTKITDIIEEFKDIPTTTELLERHYTETGNESYKLRLLISQNLLDKFTEDSIYLLKKNIKHFIFNFKKTEENNKIIEVLESFLSFSLRLLSKLPIRELEDIRSQMNETFLKVWEIMATYNLYKSLQKKNWYEINILKEHYYMKLEVLLASIDEHITTLGDNCPPIIIPKDSPYYKYTSKARQENRSQ